ncbi:uncharacterized protein LOC117644067 [Thrips palmi]|uniref:Uncharacterized protein LOC117644067 n=1 Tax=Thrips palmi TaxID=161013 RepID=A0A6P8ZLN1_THRPL|nr:uncharacterized protein LOC117644067 [Thrips palmi]
MFGGHGMFLQIYPIGCTMAILGLLPVTFNPIRVSAHPLRSTLIYCAAVTAVVLWSGFHMIQDRIAMLRDSGRSLQAYINSVLSMAHAMGVLLLPLLWLEVGRVYRNEATCAYLMESFPCTATCRWSRALTWITALSCVLVMPLSTLLYVRGIAWEGATNLHLIIHNHVFLLVFCVCAIHSAMACCVRTYANNLRRCVTDELSLKCPSPERLLKCRRAWVRLRDLAQELVVMPFTTTYLVLFVFHMITLGSYLCLTCFYESQRLFIGQIRSNFVRDKKTSSLDQ